MKTGKVWGWTEPILLLPGLEIYRLNILPNSFCSWHEHRFKGNAFYITSGRLFIEVRQKAYQLTDITSLGIGELTQVPPGLEHRFRTEDSEAECLELYYPPMTLDPLDIIRSGVGGGPKAEPIAVTTGRIRTECGCDQWGLCEKHAVRLK